MGKRTAKKKFVPQGQRDRLHRRKRTARNKLVPRGQQNRLHLNEDIQKGIKIVSRGQRNRLHQKKSTAKINMPKSCLEIDFTKRRTLQKINMPQSHHQRLHLRKGTRQKGTQIEIKKGKARKLKDKRRHL